MRVGGRAGAPATQSSRRELPACIDGDDRVIQERRNAGTPACRHSASSKNMGASKSLGIVIAVGNAKGGVGKTTVTVHLAAALGLGGYRCLIIDLDAGAGATKHLGVAADEFAGTLELLTTDEPVRRLAIADGMPTNVSLIPSRTQLSELDVRLSRFSDRTRILERPLAEARKLFDFILLDTAPAAAETTTVAAYASADWFLLSAFPHPLSLAGLNEALLDIAEVRRHRNPRLEVLGVVFSNVDGRAKRLRMDLLKHVTAALPGRVFETHISQAVILPELSSRGTLFQDGATMRLSVAQQYLRLAAEVEQRVLQREKFLAGVPLPLERAHCRTPHAPEVSLMDVIVGFAT